MQKLNSLWAPLLVVGFGLSQIGCGNDAQSASPEEEEKAEAALVPVEIDLSRTGEIAAVFAGTAILEAEEEANVVAKATGIVQKLHVEEGDYVNAGQVMAELDSERSSLELAQMEANLMGLENDLERNQELFDKNLISADSYEEIKFQHESQKAAVELARLNIAYSSIRTPISGYVSERMVKVGSMVREHDTAFRVTDFNPLLAILYVPERELTKLRTGQTAVVGVDAVQDREFRARIKRMSPVVDPETGTFKVTLEVFDDSSLLKPGMLAQVSVTYDVHNDVILVPKQAVVVEDEESSVFVVRDSVAYKTMVETGYTDDRSIEIVSGLDPQVVVVTTGQTTLKDSSKVLVIE